MVRGLAWKTSLSTGLGRLQVDGPAVDALLAVAEVRTGPRRHRMSGGADDYDGDIRGLGRFHRALYVVLESEVHLHAGANLL